MPLYTVSSKIPFSHAQQQAVVNAITQVHCDVTGAPAQFVQVIFHYGIRLRKPDSLHIMGTIRSGRSDDIKNQLIKGLSEIASQININNASQRQCRVELLDIPASWVIEGGDIMPEPGEEQAWLDNRRQTHTHTHTHTHA